MWMFVFDWGCSYLYLTGEFDWARSHLTGLRCGCLFGEFLESNRSISVDVIPMCVDRVFFLNYGVV